MGAVCALGLLQSVAPHGPEVKWQYPLNPLFLLKYKYPAVEYVLRSRLQVTKPGVRSRSRLTAK
jgi:hypothetical protein